MAKKTVVDPEEGLTFGRTIQFEVPPFGISPNTKMIFPHTRFDTARQGLMETILHGNGFGVVTGEVGTGKTTLLHRLIADLPENFDVALVMNTCLKPDELLFAIGEDLGLHEKLEPTMTRREILNAINTRLMENYRKGRRTAIIIDEAQHLSEETLETVRMISNLQTTTERPVGIMIFGQPPLREMLKRPELSPFVSRIGAHFHMEPLTLAEASEYVRHRIAAAGATQPIAFNPSATKLLHRITGGFPRRINILAGKSLLDALGSGRFEVGVADIKKAATSVMMSADPKRRERTLVTAASWLLVALLAAFGAQRYFTPPVDAVDVAPLVSRPVDAAPPVQRTVTRTPEVYASPVPLVVLAPGSRGDEVTALQEKLRNLGYYRAKNITGYYGDFTERAVRSFQSAKKIREDGVGPLTRAALEESIP